MEPVARADAELDRATADLYDLCVFTTRAGGRGSRSGPAFINGASFNPRVLVALLNIFRVHYNWFEARQYVAPWTIDAGTADTDAGLISVRVPGTDKAIAAEKRRTKKPVHRTPAMRHGMQEDRLDANGRLVMPSLHRVLYRPWLFAGTPLWSKFEDERVDLRRSTRVRQERSAPTRVRPIAKASATQSSN